MPPGVAPAPVVPPFVVAPSVAALPVVVLLPVVVVVPELAAPEVVLPVVVPPVAGLAACRGAGRGVGIATHFCCGVHRPPAAWHAAGVVSLPVGAASARPGAITASPTQPASTTAALRLLRRPLIASSLLSVPAAGPAVPPVLRTESDCRYRHAAGIPEPRLRTPERATPRAALRRGTACAGLGR
jgi:hypothetical protein